MFQVILGFDDLHLERGQSAFCLKTARNATRDVRLHAFGTRRSTSAPSLDGADANPPVLIALYLTDRRRWLSSEAISAVQAGEARGVVDHTSYTEPGVLRDRGAMERAAARVMSRMGFVAAGMIDVCCRSISFFAHAAARIAEALGCQTEVVLVEISLFRVYDDSHEGEVLSTDRVLFSSSSSSAPIKNVETVELRGGMGSCVICLEDLCAGMQAARTGCGHVYHRDCLHKWLRRTPVCPMCRELLIVSPNKTAAALH